MSNAKSSISFRSKVVSDHVTNKKIKKCNNDPTPGSELKLSFVNFLKSVKTTATKYKVEPTRDYIEISNVQFVILFLLLSVIIGFIYFFSM